MKNSKELFKIFKSKEPSGRKLDFKIKKLSMNA